MATQTTLGKDDIIAAIGNMSVFELAELIEAFKAKFNVTTAAPVAAAPAAGAAAGGAAAPAVEEETEFTGVLKSGGGKKMQAMAQVRAVTKRTVKEAKEPVKAGGGGREGGSKHET